MTTIPKSQRGMGLSWPKKERVLTREGVEIDVSGDQWVLPIVIRGHSRLNFGQIQDLQLRDSLKRYVCDRLVRISASAGYEAFYRVWPVLKKVEKIADVKSIHDRLIDLFEVSINEKREKKKLWEMYRPIKWYVWCAENLHCEAFSDAYAAELDAMVIPGGPKGEAVRMSDPDMGPLHKALEIPLLVAALENDHSPDYEHLQQRAVMALSLAFGRNPANLTYLRETDLTKVDPASEDPCFILRMPRIKKRLLNPRDDLLDEYLDPKFGRIIEDLVNKNRSISLRHEGWDFSKPENRPLLIKRNGNLVAVLSGDHPNVFNMCSNDILRLISGFVKRHNLISPLTGELINVTPRRLRYTLATGLAAEGISRRELARILDHTDTQHVGVYFEVAGRIVEHLDKATAKGFSRYLNLFRGTLVSGDDEAINGWRDDKHLIFIDDQNPDDHSDIGVCGKSSLCHLDPPYSCYLCPKFQPYLTADHEHVLDCLLAQREDRLKRYENARLGIQLDEVIAAVAEVAQLCDEARLSD